MLPVALISVVALSYSTYATGQATGGTNFTRTVQLVMSGPLVIEDADTIRLAGQRMQLFGIEAPSLTDRCRAGEDNRTDCGVDAMVVLLEIIDPAETFECILQYVNQADDLVVVCFSDEFDATGIDKQTNDLAEILVLRGFARRDSSETSPDAGIYTAAERVAEQAKVGFWDCIAATPRSWARDKDRYCE